MVFLNTTGTLGTIITQATSGITGDIYLTLLGIFLVLLAISIMFGIPLEITGIFIFPYVILCATYYSNWIPLLVVFILYFAYLFTKRFIFR